MRDQHDGALMRVILGKLAIEFGIDAAASADPMLFKSALDLFTASASGSAMESRGALVLLLLGSPDLAGALPVLTARVGWDAAPLGGHVYAVIERMGGDPGMAAQAVLSALRSAQDARKAPAPAPVAERPPEPAPGRSEGHRVTLAPKVSAGEG